MSVNFYDLCRICTATSANEKINVFSVESKSKNLTAKIAECLALEIEEKDRLPKVICIQCMQHIEFISELRNTCKNTQIILNNCLNATQHNGKVYLKDALNINNSNSNNNNNNKNLHLYGGGDDYCNSTASTVLNVTSMPQAQPAQQAQPISFQSNNFLNQIMQAVGIQQQSPQQYTITLDNKSLKAATEPLTMPTQYKIEGNTLQQMPPPPPPLQTQPAATPPQSTTMQQMRLGKDATINSLEEYLKMKPNIKVTPLGKRDNNNTLQKTQIHQSQTAPPPPLTQQQPLTASPTSLPLPPPPSPQQSQSPQQISSIQLQQLQQQLQQLTSQLQTSTQPQITLTATTASSAIPNVPSDALSPAKSKRPKLNFVLTSPTTTTNTPVTQQTLSSTLPQLTPAPTSAVMHHQQTQQNQQQPTQIQLQLQTTAQAMQQQQVTAALLSNLAPLLQQQVTGSAATASSILSPNKCFLPITIKDENSDQQIVAHIDAKNFMLPTTYQLQMKLQPQIATVDGQPIMQLTPTSIPATLQITPQPAVATHHHHQTFQTGVGVGVGGGGQLQHQSQQQMHQNVQITSQQIIKGATTTSSSMPTSAAIPATMPMDNFNVAGGGGCGTNDVATSTQHDELLDNFHLKQVQQLQMQHQKAQRIKQQKYTITQQPGSNTIEITPTTNFTQQIMQQVQEQQKQKQQLKQEQSLLLAGSTTTTTMPTQHGAITVQRINTTTPSSSTPSSAKANITKLQLKQETTPTKLPVLNAQNVTISRITPPQQPQQQRMPPMAKQQQNKAKLHPTQTQILNALPQIKQELMTTTVQAQKMQQPVTTSTEWYPNSNQIKKLEPHQSLQQQPVTTKTLPTKKVLRNKLVKNTPQATVTQQRQPTKLPTMATTNMSKRAGTITTTTMPKAEGTTAFARTVNAAVSNNHNNNSIITNNSSNFNTSTQATTNASTIRNDSTLTGGDATTTAAATAAVTTSLECNQCGRVFKKKEHLTQHVKLHAGLRPFKCSSDGCDKTFSRKEHLLRHLVSHTGQKMFSCDVCQKLFSRKDNLNKHKRIHSGQPNASNYACEVCNKTFAVKTYYEQHKTMHVKTEIAAGSAIKVKNEKKSAPQHRVVNISNATITNHNNNNANNHHSQQQTQQIHLVQQTNQSQQQIMHLQLPTVVTTQDLAGNTITITQSANDLNNTHDATVLNLPTSLANFVQLGQTQFVNATTGQIIKLEK